MFQIIWNIVLTISVAVLLAVNIGYVAYFFWLLVWLIYPLFNVMSYFWATCDTVLTVSWIFNWAVILLLILKLYSHFKPWWN